MLQIRWENRYMGDRDCFCLVTVDGTDFPIYEPEPFDEKWYSHKFEGPALRYELCVCIQTGWIVWTNGPFPAGLWPDLVISRNQLVDELDENERLLADGGYQDAYSNYFETPTGYNNADQYMKGVARARHETINGRLRRWGILRCRYRHNLEDHGRWFLAIANITQIIIEHEEPAFQIEYSDD